jgi:hypothetical protein
VVDVGGWAVYVPAALSWSHEHADPTDRSRQRFFERPTLDGLPEFVASFGRARPTRGRATARLKGGETATRFIGVRGTSARRLSAGAERKKR